MILKCLWVCAVPYSTERVLMIYRGKHENIGKQAGDNFERKKRCSFVILEVRNVKVTSFYMLPKWTSSSFNIVQKCLERCREDKQKLL